MNAAVKELCSGGVTQVHKHAIKMQCNEALIEAIKDSMERHPTWAWGQERLSGENDTPGKMSDIS